MSGEAPLPSTRALLTHILNHLSTFPQDPITNATTNPATTSTESHDEPNHPLLPPTTKSHLLALHSLLPHCLLPALDLLDRGLVERWIPLDSNPPATTKPSSWVYYITSKPAPSISSEFTNPFHSSTSTTPSTYTYEARPSIWHCTCANFTLYALASAAEPATTYSNAAEGNIVDKTVWIWGSQHLSPYHPSTIPVCKHLLAAVLAEKCPALFGAFVKEKQGVLKGEMAEKACWWD